MRKATHNGHCQVCGRVQALPNGGTLSLHGYRVAGFGFFNGVCHGARFAPLQESRAITDKIIVELGQYAARQDEMVAELKAGTRTPLTAKTGKHIEVMKTGRRGMKYKGWEDEVVPFAQAPSYYQVQAVEGAVFFHEREARQARSHARDMAQLADRIHGTELIPVEPESGSKVAKAGDRISVYDTEVELVERTDVTRGWSRRGGYGWLVRRVDNGKTFKVADAQVTRALKRAAQLTA
jgi:hypothetical protein